MVKVTKVSQAASILALMTAAVAAAAAAGDATFLTRNIGGIEIRLPLIAGMVAACDRDAALAQRAAALTPTSAEFVTCMASPAVLEAMRKHVRHDSYPLLAVSMVRELKGGPLTAEEFAKLKALAMQRMASMVTAPDSAQQELDRQDQGIASKGGTLKRTNEGMDFGGFFTYTREQPSFTYLVTRSTVMTEAGASERTCEVNAASMLFWHGRMLGLSVIDHCAGTPKDARATSITHTWLTTFESLNPGGSSQHR